jgi:hypothetical protein
MQSKLIRHVGHLICLIVRFRKELQRTILGIVAVDCWPRIACLRETALENLHDAVCICMTAVRQRCRNNDVEVQKGASP